ncbi:MAG TPA: hypothetical protein VKT78_02570 [Fimbriimonadaceae bacterium]|nr:hypothetical protein [Fimbriimonadaceae bacterium]
MIRVPAWAIVANRASWSVLPLAAMLSTSLPAKTLADYELPGWVRIGFSYRHYPAAKLRALNSADPGILKARDLGESIGQTIYYARPARQWRARESLKRIAYPQHVDFHLDAWPPGSAGRGSDWEWGRPPAWVDLGGTSGPDPSQLHTLFGNADGSLLRSGSGGHRYYGVEARRGHLWEARELLKRLATDHHFGLRLDSWPPDSAGEGSLWENGHVVKHFSERVWSGSY